MKMKTMKKKREILVRKCVATGNRLPKTELLRIVSVDGVVVIDPTGKREGRGAYITPDADMIKKARKRNAFAKSLRMKVDEAIYDELIEMVCDLT